MKSTSDTEIRNQKDIINKIRLQNAGRSVPPKAYVETYGCAQNHSDTEKLQGMLCDMGYLLCGQKEGADLVIFNTCAVREGAELKVFGNIGALKHVKLKKPDMLVGVCGCMMQQEHIADIIRAKYKHVDIVFGTHALYRFPEILMNASGGRVFDVENCDGQIFEDISYYRSPPPVAKVPVMYGCDNFCAYCVVPYVRGRERSRRIGDITAEIRDLAKDGYKEITLLGQNVNSYGKGLDEGVNFAGLLREVCGIGGIERVRFITSHPKDISAELIEVMKTEKKVCKHLHLPVQSGSSDVLTAMNRGYSKEKYLEIIQNVRREIPDIAITSDIIVGFPTETQADFEETLDVIKKAEFDMIYSFMYSKRHGTPAEKMESVLTEEEKKKNFDKLMDLQDEISLKKNKLYIGRTEKVLVEGTSRTNENVMTGRTDGGKIVNFAGSSDMTGRLVDVKIIGTRTWSLIGELPCMVKI